MVDRRRTVKPAAKHHLRYEAIELLQPLRECNTRFYNYHVHGLFEGYNVGDIQGKAFGEQALPQSERRERLAYLADMLSELQAMAAREGCETLAGLLGLSHAEAQRKASGSAD